MAGINHLKITELNHIISLLDKLTRLREVGITLDAVSDDDSGVVLRFFDSNGECVGGLDWVTKTETYSSKKIGEYVLETTGIKA